MFKQSILIAGVAALALGAAQPAAASYSCTVTPDGKNVVVKVTNADSFAKSCSINCHFKMPGGSASISCSNSVPANAKDHELCVKSTGGDKYTFKEGDEQCWKQG